MPDEPKRREPQSTVTDATRHVGRTLESEGNFADVTGTALPIANRQPGDSAAGASDAVEIRGEDADSSDPSTAGLVSSGTPALKTRLPGDTSSDPHTDLDTDLKSDNAATAQNRREEKQRGAA